MLRCQKYLCVFYIHIFIYVQLHKNMRTQYRPFLLKNSAREQFCIFQQISIQVFTFHLFLFIYLSFFYFLENLKLFVWNEVEALSSLRTDIRFLLSQFVPRITSIYRYHRFSTTVLFFHELQMIYESRLCYVESELLSRLFERLVSVSQKFTMEN